MSARLCPGIPADVPGTLKVPGTFSRAGIEVCTHVRLLAVLHVQGFIAPRKARRNPADPSFARVLRRIRASVSSRRSTRLDRDRRHGPIPKVLPTAAFGATCSTDRAKGRPATSRISGDPHHVGVMPTWPAFWGLER